MVSGTELDKQEFIDKVKIDYYDENDDYVAVSGEFSNILILTEEDMFIAYPEDTHLTRAKVSSPVKVKKLIFKIPVE